MTNLIVELAKYIFIILICFYTYQSFNVFRTHDLKKQKRIFFNQNYLMFLMHLMANLIIYVKTDDIKIWIFYIMQLLFIGLILIVYCFFYKKSSRLITNNMCMLLLISFIILTRIDYQSAMRQYQMAFFSFLICLFIPKLIQKTSFFRELGWVYGIAGIGTLSIVAIFGATDYGANLAISIGSFSLQPSEFIKIIFVFFIASMFYQSKTKKQIIITTVLAAIHVIILVASTDLGMALIFFIVYLSMLYAGTQNIGLTILGLGGGAFASVAAYHLFNHIKVRVRAWKDPFLYYDHGGYQIAQSLFAIGTGGWFGMGLYQGSPSKIPVVKKDFIFSAIVEEMGAIFGICLILICLSCFIMFVNISIQLKNEFYKLVAFGLGVAYAIQVFLTIGGGIKFIPLTGMTLPLVSTGGSSMLSTMIMFSVIQGMYILRENEGDNSEENEERFSTKETNSAPRKRAGHTGSGAKRRSK